MITNLIVMLSLAFGVVYTFIWFMRQDFRDQIEQPKYRFQNQLEKFENNRPSEDGTEKESVHD